MRRLPRHVVPFARRSPCGTRRDRTFVGKKEKRCNAREKRSGELGDQYLFTALCQDSKLLFSHLVGRRTAETTDAFVADVESRMVRQPGPFGDMPQISTDGWGPYRSAIAREFGDTAGHGVIVKGYQDPNVGRYAPPTLIGSERTNVYGIANLWTICTSHRRREGRTSEQASKPSG